MRQGIRALLSLRQTPDLAEAAAYLTAPCSRCFAVCRTSSKFTR